MWNGDIQGRIQDFKLGGALKQIAPSGGRHENFWNIRFLYLIYQGRIQGGGAPGAHPP
jgi:hypothetical protein